MIDTLDNFVSADKTPIVGHPRFEHISTSFASVRI